MRRDDSDTSTSRRSRLTSSSHFPSTVHSSLAALHLVLHCLPGPIERKAVAVANVAGVLAPTGVLFGATVLGASGPQTRLSRSVLRVFNRQGGFDNMDDSEEGLRGILARSFHEVEVDVVGSVALFVATTPRA